MRHFMLLGIFAIYFVVATDCSANPPFQPRLSTRLGHNAKTFFEGFRAVPAGFENALELTFENVSGSVILQGQLGVGLPSSVGMPQDCEPGEHDQCYVYGDYAKLYYKTTNNCTHFEWESTYAKRLEDCFDLLPGAHWYGGGETYVQTWPIEGQIRGEAPMVTGDSISGQEYGSLTENYWLVSTGVAIHVTEDTPLFISWGSVHPGKVCFVAQPKFPYHERESVSLKYDICTGENIKEVHKEAIGQFYPKPTGSPDETMILYPFWSTWAQYKTEVNETIVLEYAHRIKSEGFLTNSHIEIDDHWESCYGERQFDSTKFPDPKGMVEELNSMDLKVTLWIHPFINYECPSFTTCIEQQYFTKDFKTKPAITSWWQGSTSGIIDYTNSDAVAWWSAGLTKLQTEYGIDSFKFDAGETNWLPYSSKLSGDAQLQPNLYSTKYVEAVAQFGGMVEVRTGRRNQNEPIFTRMLDKDSRWGYDNGLRSLIPTLLHFGIVGYPFVLPDMIGGNAYGGEKPSGELFIRWMQANAFMPSVQFSIVPWEYSSEIIQLTKDALALRALYNDVILEAVAEAVSDGTPINRPIWWIAPEDPQAFTIDDQYMLGDDILVAPILDEGKEMRNIYLPEGTWESHLGVAYTGPTWILDYPAPLQVLPFFLRN